MNKRLLRSITITIALAAVVAACSPTAVTPGDATAPPTPAPTNVPVTVPVTNVPVDTVAPTAAPATPTEPGQAETPEATAVATAAGPVDPAAYTFAEVADGFANPVLVTHAGDGSGRLFVVEQVGAIRIIQDGAVLPDPFYDMTGQVSQAYEQGLLGLAFSPHYAEDGAFFINYTDLDGDTHIDRCRVAADDANHGGECVTILVVDDPYVNHNGGHLIFGPDGYLYIGMGDGGGGNDPDDRAQDLSQLLGKLLRLDVSGDAATYTSPPDNPFAGQAGAREEIWAYGLRNPWRFSFDRATGDLYLGDVGQNAFEEVDYQPGGSAGGENYGWPYLEGRRVNTEANDAAPDGFSSVPPLTSYAQEVGGCTVVGGYVYRGPSLPELNGVYFFADFCSGLVWVLPAGTPDPSVTQWASTGVSISSFGEDEAGELYLVSLSGTVYRLERGR